MEGKAQEDLWAALELAVRTHAETLPVDAFLPDPKQVVSRLMRERAEKRRPAPVAEAPETPSHDESFQELVEATEIIEPPTPVKEARSVEDELRSKLSGNSFAELDDV